VNFPVALRDVRMYNVLMTTTNCVAIDPATGLHLRSATDEERAAYLGQGAHPAFRRPVRVGAVLVDEDSGPGVWFGGAGF
jgi:hypothetical protein